MTHQAIIANISGNFFNDYDKNVIILFISKLPKLYIFLYKLGLIWSLIQILPKEDDTHYSHLPSAYAPERSIQVSSETFSTYSFPPKKLYAKIFKLSEWSILTSKTQINAFVKIIMMVVGGRIAFGNTDVNFFKNVSIVKPSFLITVPYVIRAISQKVKKYFHFFSNFMKAIYTSNIYIELIEYLITLY